MKSCPLLAASVLLISIALSCGGAPDSYEIVIRAEDLERSPIVDPVAGNPDTMVFRPDTIRLPVDSLYDDSLDSASVDSLPDSLRITADTLLTPVDAAESPWVFMALEIRGSLYSSIEGVRGIDPAVLGAHCVRCMWWDIDPWRDLIAGDSLYILFDTLGSGRRENSIVCLRYVPVHGSTNHPFTAFTYLKAGDNYPSIWYSDGREVVRLLDRMPVPTFEEITGIYGEPREGHTHAGVDFKAPEGTPVRTLMGGTVSRTNWNTAYNGYCVEVDMGGYSEIFIHLEGISPGISPGTSLAAGDQIGTVGNTGSSYTPHLHYQINDSEGNAIDPYLYFSSHARWLGEEDIEEFREFRERCDTLLSQGDRT
jgi:hypothetical protein